MATTDHKTYMMIIVTMRVFLDMPQENVSLKKNRLLQNPHPHLSAVLLRQDSKQNVFVNLR